MAGDHLLTWDRPKVDFFLFLFYFRGLETPIGAKRILSHLYAWCYLLWRLQRKQVFREEQVLQSRQWRKCSKKKVLMMTEHNKWSISEGIVMGFRRWSQDKGSWEHRTCEFRARGMSWLSWLDFCYLIHSGMTSINYQSRACIYGHGLISGSVIFWIILRLCLYCLLFLIYLSQCSSFGQLLFILQLQELCSDLFSVPITLCK